MTCLICGGAKSGKSALAQRIAVELADGGPLYYVATMISSGKEDDARIRRHLQERDGMGFETILCTKNVLDCLTQCARQGTFLVDNTTSLLQNALFPVENHYQPDAAGAARCANELVEFATCVRHAIFVSDYIYAEPRQYDPGTEDYRRRLAEIDCRLAVVCDAVIEVTAGNAIVHKGVWNG